MPYGRSGYSNAPMSEYDKRQRYLLVAEACKTCAECGAVHTGLTKRGDQATHKLFDKMSKIAIRGTPWNIKTYDLSNLIGLCKNCIVDLAMVSPEQTTIHSVSQARPTQHVVSMSKADAYMGPPHKWLALQVIELCRKAAIRFDEPVLPQDLLSRLPEDFDMTSLPDEAENGTQTTTPVTQVVTKPKTKATCLHRACNQPLGHEGAHTFPNWVCQTCFQDHEALTASKTHFVCSPYKFE